MSYYHVILYLCVTKHYGDASDFTIRFHMRWNSIAKFEQFVAFDLSYDLSGNTTRDPGVVE